MKEPGKGIALTRGRIRETFASASQKLRQQNSAEQNIDARAAKKGLKMERGGQEADRFPDTGQNVHYILFILMQFLIRAKLKCYPSATKRQCH